MISGTSVKERTIQTFFSFFIKTVIDWNHLEDDIADTTLSEAFWEYLSSDQLLLLTLMASALSLARCVITLQYWFCGVFLQVQIEYNRLQLKLKCPDVRLRQLADFLQ